LNLLECVNVVGTASNHDVKHSTTEKWKIFTIRKVTELDYYGIFKETEW